MVIGLIQYRTGMERLGDIGKLKTDDTPERVAAKEREFFVTFFGVVAVIALFGLLVSNGTIPVTLTQIATWLGVGVLVMVALYFVYVWTSGGHTVEENKKMAVIFWLFLLIAVFWAGFEQAGTSFTLFARDATFRDFALKIPFTDIGPDELPVAWFQTVNAGFIILLAPVFGMVWVWLDSRQKNPSLPLKAGLGLVGLGAGFFVMAWGAANASNGNLVSPAWLVVTYFLHTVGELCISPIGLSAITEAVAGTARRSDDGDLVRGRCAGQRVRGPRGWARRNDGVR